MKSNRKRAGIILWFLLLMLVIALGNLTAYSRNTSILDATGTATGTAMPYHVSITTSGFRISLLSASADDLSNPGHVLFHLQNGTSLWYGIAVTSTPAGIVPTTATPTDTVSSTFLNPVPLLPPAQVLPLDSWNGSYHFESLQLNISFSGPGQQVQIALSPTEPRALTLDVLTILLHLLGEHSEGTQIGLLENGLLANIFSETSSMKDFESLVQDYGQLFTSEQDSMQSMPSPQSLAQAYACALDISNLLADTSEQTILADVLWRIQGKAISRDSVLQAITSFSQAQFGLAVEGFMKGQATTLAPLFTSGDAPTVLLQTVSNVTPSPIVSETPTLSPTTTVIGTATSPISPLTPTVPVSASPNARLTITPIATAHTP